MMDQHKATLKNLKNTIKYLEDLKIKTESVCEEDPLAVPPDLASPALTSKIMYYKAVLTVYKYFIKKLGNKSYLMLGNYIGIYMSTSSGLSLNLCVENDKIESKLYTLEFGSSYSSLHVFTQECFPEVFSVIFENYRSSHHNFKRIFDFFGRFGYIDQERSLLCWSQSAFDEQINTAKQLIDWLFSLSENTELMTDIDKVLATYFEVVIKYNKK